MPLSRPDDASSSSSGRTSSKERPSVAKEKSGSVVLYLEAHPKAVRRALRADPDPGNAAAQFEVVDLHRSDPKNGEHGNTTLVLGHSYDDTTWQVFKQRLVAESNRQHESLFNDDDEDAA